MAKSSIKLSDLVYGKKEGVQGDLLTSLIAKIEKDNVSPQQSPFYKPSSMKCRRAMYYVRRGFPSESSPDYGMVGICESGTDRHVHLQTAISGLDKWEWVDVGKYVTENNLELEVLSYTGTECKLYSDKYKIRFMCDGLLKYKGKYYILEIKTESTFKWQNRTDVDDGHKDQATTYSMLLQVPNVIFLYENRDVCKLKAFMFNVSKEKWEQTSERILGVEAMVNRHELPPAEESSYACKYCPFATLCKEDNNGE